MYPDPPTDAQNLDIQQQALLREQQRKIRLMKREQEHGQWNPPPNTHTRFSSNFLLTSLICDLLQTFWTSN